jgi:hypothetical protein
MDINMSQNDPYQMIGQTLHKYLPAGADFVIFLAEPHDEYVDSHEAYLKEGEVSYPSGFKKAEDSVCLTHGCQALKKMFEGDPHQRWQQMIFKVFPSGKFEVAFQRDRADGHLPFWQRSNAIMAELKARDYEPTPPKLSS